jgi:hypothetical protein
MKFLIVDYKHCIDVNILYESSEAWIYWMVIFAHWERRWPSKEESVLPLVDQNMWNTDAVNVFSFISGVHNLTAVHLTLVANVFFIIYNINACIIQLIEF